MADGGKISSHGPFGQVRSEVIATVNWELAIWQTGELASWQTCKLVLVDALVAALGLDDVV